MCNVFLIGILSFAGISVDVKPLAGPTVQGELTGINVDSVIVQSGGSEQRLELTSLWELTPAAPVGDSADVPSVWVELVDGSRINAKQFTATGGTAIVHLMDGGNLSIRTRLIHAVRLKSHAGATKIANRWREIISAKSVGDVVVIRQGEELENLEGVLGDVTEEVVHFEYDGENFEVSRGKLDGFTYYHPASGELPDRLCQLTDASGSHWSVKSLQLADEKFELVSVAGVEYSLPVEQLKKIDFSSGNRIWLSDLTPESVEWRPFVHSVLPEPRLMQLFHPREDIGLTQKPLTLDGNVYSKGLAIRSRTELMYRLTDDFRQFHAIVGIDDHVRDGGNVDLVISGDGKVLFSRNITGRDEAVPVDLDITGVKRLKILVDFGQELDIADHLNLCDARITK